MSYCDFNPRLFKPFTSVKKKIIPAMSDDWVMIPKQYSKREGFGLYSKKLDQLVQDIDLKRFLIFCGDNNLTIEGLKLRGHYIIGNDRSVYNLDTYGKWKEKFEKRTEVIIPPKDYKPGYAYKTPCGSTLVYLGFRYVSTLRNPTKEDPNQSKTTKLTKKHYVYSRALEKRFDFNYRYNYMYVEQLKQKFNEELGQELLPNQIDFLLSLRFLHDSNIAGFVSKKPKVEEYEQRLFPNVDFVSKDHRVARKSIETVLRYVLKEEANY